MDLFVVMVILGALSLILAHFLLRRAKREAVILRKAHDAIALQYADLEEENKKLQGTIRGLQLELDKERLNHIVKVDQVTVSGYQSSRDLLDQIAQLQADLGSAQQLIQEKTEENAVLFALSTTDPLTGLANRRGLGLRFVDEYARLKRNLTSDPRTPQRIVALSVDLDDFSKLNDLVDHQHGDRGVRAFASLLGSYFRRRPTDVAARMGGDEFFVLLPGATTDLAVARSFELLNAMRNEPALKWYTDEPGVTASIGITIGTLTADMSASTWLETLLRESDQAQQEAKRAGKGTVCLYREPNLGIQLPGL